MKPFGPRGPGLPPQRHVFGAAFYTHVETIARPNENLPIEPPSIPFYGEISTSQQDEISTSSTSSTSKKKGDPIYMRKLRRITLPAILYTRSTQISHPNDPRRARQLERERTEFRNQWVKGTDDGRATTFGGRSSESRVDNRRRNANNELEETRLSDENNTTTLATDTTRVFGVFVRETKRETKKQETELEEIPNVDLQRRQSFVDDVRSPVKEDIIEYEESSSDQSEIIQEDTVEHSSEESSSTIEAIEATIKLEPIESTPCENLDVSFNASETIPELLAEDVGNRIPECMTKSPRTAITLNLNSHGAASICKKDRPEEKCATKRPRIIDDLICVEGTIFSRSSLTKISESFAESSPAKKSKCDEVIVDEKQGEEEEEEEEEELVNIMANAVEEIEEEEQLMNETIPKKRRKESRMSMDSGVCLNEVTSERATVSPDEFHEKIAETIERIPAVQDEVNTIETSEKSCDFEPLVRSMPLLDSFSPEKKTNAISENLPDNSPDKPEINLDNFGGKFKILITPIDSKGADAFAPMSLEYDLTNGSHVSTTTCMTQFVSKDNSTTAEKTNEIYDELSKLLEIDPKKDCQITQQGNTISILEEKDAPVQTKEKDVEMKLLDADTAKILVENCDSSSQTKCEVKTVETNRGDDSTVNCKNLNQKTILSTTETHVNNKIVNSTDLDQNSVSSVAELYLKDKIVDSAESNQKSVWSVAELCIKDKIANFEESNQKSISSVAEMCLKDEIVDSEDSNQKTHSSIAETCLKEKIIDSEDSKQKSILPATKTLNEVKESDDSDQRTILSATETCSNDNSLNPKTSDEKAVSFVKETFINEDTSNPTNFNEKTESSATETCSNDDKFNPKNWDEKIVSSAKETRNNEDKLNPTIINEKITSSATETCINDDELNSTLSRLNSKNADQRAIISSTTDDINSQISSQSVHPAPQIETVVIKKEIPEVEELEIKKELPEVAIENQSTEEQQISVENTKSPTESSEIQEPGNKNPAVNSEDNQSPPIPMAKIRLLHHHELGSRWCPTPMNRNVPSICEANKFDEIRPTVAPINIQPRLQATNSAEIPGSQLHYLPFLLSNSVPVIMTNTPNLYNNTALNCCNIPGKYPAYPPPDYAVPQKGPMAGNINFPSSTKTSNNPNLYSNTAPNSYTIAERQLIYRRPDIPASLESNGSKKAPSPGNTNFSSANITNNTPNLSGKEAPNNYNVPGKQLIYFNPGLPVPQGTTINKETTSRVNTNYPTNTITNNIPNSYSKEVPNNYNVPGKQFVYLHPGYFAPQGTTMTKEATSVSKTYLPSSTITSNNRNLYSEAGPNCYNILETQLASLPQGYSVSQKTTNSQKVPSPPYTNYPANTITSNLYSKDAPVGYNIVQKQTSSLLLDYTVAQGTTNNQKAPSPGDTNFSSSTITSNSPNFYGKEAQNGQNIQQNQVTNLPPSYPVVQGAKNIQKGTSPANTNFPSSTITSNSPNLYGKEAPNGQNIQQNQVTNLPPTYPVIQGATNIQKSPSPANTNFPSSTMTSNSPNLYRKGVQNGQNIQQNQVTNLPPTYPVIQGATNIQKSPSPSNTNFPSSTMTSNSPNLYSKGVQNGQNIQQNQVTNLPPTYPVIQGATNIQKSPSPANTNFPSSTMTSNSPNLYSKGVQNGQNIQQNQVTNLPPTYPVIQGATNIQKSPSPSNTNFPSSTMTSNSPNLYSKGVQNGQNIQQNQVTNLPPTYPVIQGATNIQKSPSPANTNFPSSTMTSNSPNLYSKGVQNGQNIQQNQVTNLPPTYPVVQGARNIQKVPSPANPSIPTNSQNCCFEYPSADSVFSRLHDCVRGLQNCIRLSNIPAPIHQQAQLQKDFQEKKKLLFNEITKYCILLGTNNINIAIKDFVTQYERLVEPNNRIFNIMEIMSIFRLNSLRLSEQSVQGVQTSSATNSASRRQYAKKNSTSRVAENKQRRSAVAQTTSTASQSGSTNSRTPPTFASAVSQPGSTNLQTTSTVSQSGSTNARATSSTLQPQFPRPRQPSLAPTLNWIQGQYENGEWRNFLYPTEREIVFRQITQYYDLYNKIQYDLANQQTWRNAYQQALAKIVHEQNELNRRTINRGEMPGVTSSMEQNTTNQQPELRQSPLMTTQQEINTSQRRLNSNSTFVPSTMNNPQAQQNSSREQIYGGNLENIRNLAGNLETQEKIIVQNPTISGNQAGIPVSVENTNTRQEIRQSVINSAQKISYQDYIESTLRSYLSEMDGNNDKVQLQKSTGTTAQQNPLDDRANFSVSVNNNDAQLQMRLNSATTIQPNTPQEAINLRNAQLEMRRSPATNQQRESQESEASKNQKTNQTQRQSFAANSGQDYTTQELINCSSSSETLATNQQNHSDETTGEQMDNDVQWEVHTSPLKTSNQQRPKDLKVRLKRINIAATDDSDNPLEPVSVFVDNSVAEIQKIASEESLHNNSENVSVSVEETLPEGRKTPGSNQEIIQENSSTLPCNNSTAIAKPIDLSGILTTEVPELRQNSAAPIDEKTENSNSKTIEKSSGSRCNVRVVDVLEEFDTLSSVARRKGSNSKDAQIPASSTQQKSLPLVTSIVPLDLIEKSAKTAIQESEEEDNDFTLYQSEDESTVSSASQISVITINDDDEDDDDFNLTWIDESKTAESATEEEAEIQQITLQETAETGEQEENEIEEITLSKNAKTAENEENEIEEATLLKISEAVNADEETVDKTSHEITVIGEEIQDEPTEIFSILDVKSISKDVFNNMGDSDYNEPAMSSRILESREEPDNLEIKEDMLPNCSRCGKASSVVCEQCYSAFYCSAECHTNHWAEIHHLSCKPDVPEKARELMP